MPKKSVAGTKDDPTMKFAKLVVDEKEYSLCYSFNAIALAERYADCNLLMGLENITNLTALQLRGLLFAALSVAHPEITIDEAGALVRIDTLIPITKAIGEAYMMAMPAKKVEEKKSELVSEGS